MIFVRFRKAFVCVFVFWSVVFFAAMAVARGDAFAAQAETPRGQGAKGPPLNVILIVVDTLRADHLSCYGYPRATSGHIDALAKKSVVFEKAYSQATWTLPSVASLWTSKYVFRHKVFSLRSRLPSSELTLAKIFKIFGYRTAAFTAGIFLNGKFGLSQGFDFYEDVPFPEDTDLINRTPSTPLPEIFPRIARWIDAHKKERFFLYMHLLDVHPPLALPGDGDQDKYDPGYKGVVDDFSLDLPLGGRVAGSLVFNEDGTVLRLQQKDIDHIIARYDAGIYYTDAYLGRLFEQLEKTGLMKNSLIIVTADHGIDLFDHGTLFAYARQVPYEELIHVPLIIFNPREGVPRKVSVPVGLIDILPTVLELNGIDPPEGIDGYSLAGLMQGREEDRDVFLKRPVHSFNSPLRRTDMTPGRSIFRISDWKIFYITEHFPSPTKCEYALYDLRNDPREQRNLIFENRDVAADMVLQFRQWLRREFPDMFSGGRKSPMDAEPQDYGPGPGRSAGGSSEEE